MVTPCTVYGFQCETVVGPIRKLARLAFTLYYASRIDWFRTGESGQLAICTNRSTLFRMMRDNRFVPVRSPIPLSRTFPSTHARHSILSRPYAELTFVTHNILYRHLTRSIHCAHVNTHLSFPKHLRASNKKYSRFLQICAIITLVDAKESRLIPHLIHN